MSMNAMFVGWMEWDGTRVTCKYSDRAYMSLAKARNVLNKVKAERQDSLLSAWVERRDEAGEKTSVALHEVYIKSECVNVP